MLGRLRRSIQSFFQVSRSESNAFMILIPVMVLILFSEYIYRQWWFAQPRDTQADQRKLDSLMSNWPTDSVQNVKVPLVSFNPNEATLNFLVSTGLRSDVAQRILKYRSKGGTFKTKADLLRMYGMDSTWFRQVQPWLSLPDTLPRRVQRQETPRASKAVNLRDINLVDSLALLEVRGIGPVFANRILRFRRALGGFHTIQQLDEVYKIDTTVLRTLKSQFFVAGDFQVKKISINTADEATLARHPYLSNSQAKAIAAYRFQHGAFQSVEDLRKIQLISEADWQRIIPYLEL
jgi:DNA uptake protein ComE-like DNA-binding protein